MRLFLHLLLNAVHNKQYIFGIHLSRGQYYSSSRALGEQLHLSTKYITESIKKLRDSGEITTERYGNGTIFTITNYDDYQGNESRKNDREQHKGNGIGSTDF
jgi:CTP-dependent riboflavin kinase